jgi:hypothetical protein
MLKVSLPLGGRPCPGVPALAEHHGQQQQQQQLLPCAATASFCAGTTVQPQSQSCCSSVDLCVSPQRAAEEARCTCVGRRHR